MCAISQPAKTPGPDHPPVATSSRRSVAIAASLIVLAALAAYWNTFSAPFVFDDVPGILDNASIRHLSPLSAVLLPPPDSGSPGGRPVVNLSLAINYALGGTDVRGYHALNLVFHALAALALFGIVRRTLEKRPGLRHASPYFAALGVTLLWTVHPLQTESVTCIIQRTELLGGLFYLLTLYCFIRATDAGASPAWQVGCVVACLLGMASKEFMVSAPLMAWLYDRTFVAGSFRAAWRQRSRLYLALMSTWLLLAVLMLANASRNGTAGLGHGMTSWEYALTQCRALVLYLRLAFWPRPLVLDYGTEVVRNAWDVLPQALLLGVLLLSTVAAVWLRPAAGFVGAWFFAILAPSSSVVPLVTQTMAEHRMYLPLAAVLTATVLTLQSFAGRRSLVLSGLLAIALVAVTRQRNEVYRSVESAWTDTLTQRPSNLRAHLALGRTFADSDRPAKAIAEYEVALRLRPDYPEAHINLGEILSKSGRTAEAIEYLTTALRLKPESAEAQLNLAAALDRSGQTAEAIPHYEEALRLKPRLAEAHDDLGNALLRSGRLEEAIGHIKEALRLKPEYADAHYNLANALVQAGHPAEAAAEFAAGQRLNPRDAVARHNWANALAAAGRLPEALSEYEAALKESPTDSQLLYDYGNGLGSAGRFQDAVRPFTEALRVKPNFPEAHNNLGNALLMLDQVPEAIAEYQASLRLKPANASGHNNLGLALARLGRLDEAVEQFAAAVQLAPEFQQARENLAHAQGELPGAPEKK
jgi:tetratricopeptide (TPR) repeat protein